MGKRAAYVAVANDIIDVGNTVTVEVDGQKEQIVSTPGHKYYLSNNTENREIGMKQEHESYITLSEKWVSACKLKAGDKVLLSDGSYGYNKLGCS